jgi:molybdenum cofactor synthesis domain-containing protein
MSQGRLLAVCTSPETGTTKTPVESATLVEGRGIEGDAHAGDWHRQVSILDEADFERTRKLLPDLVHGAFAENMVVSGLDLAAVGLGSIIDIGEGARLVVTQIGKACHEPCHIGRTTGACVLPASGVFARVLRGGRVAAGDPVRIASLVERSVLQAVVVTVSDRCHAGTAEDTAGPAVVGMLERSLGAHVYRLEVVPDERPVIEERLAHYCDGHTIDLVLTVGGTGLSPRDVTPEATRAVLERLTPGFDEAMRAASASKTPHAMLSRGVSGVRGATLVVNLPGSRKAAEENLEAILPALPHGLSKLRGSREDCG